MGRPNAPGGYGMPRGYDAGRSNNAIPAAAPAKTAASTETSDAATVTISQMRFNAPTITIKVGGRVTWTNSEGIPHTVTADDESFGSSRLSAGETFSYTFNEPGTYTYYCQLHPMMRATVVVEA
ncbi:MAG: cupredoxin family copper-binding protein [Sedimenticolaceae bacterium]